MHFSRKNSTYLMVAFHIILCRDDIVRFFLLTIIIFQTVIFMY